MRPTRPTIQRKDFSYFAGSINDFRDWQEGRIELGAILEDMQRETSFILSFNSPEARIHAVHDLIGAVAVSVEEGALTPREAVVAVVDEIAHLASEALPLLKTTEPQLKRIIDLSAHFVDACAQKHDELPIGGFLDIQNATEGRHHLPEVVRQLSRLSRDYFHDTFETPHIQLLPEWEEDGLEAIKFSPIDGPPVFVIGNEVEYAP